MRVGATLTVIAMCMLAGACDGGERGSTGGSADTLAVAPASTGGSADTHAAAGDTAAADPSGHAHAAEGEGLALLPIMQKLGADMTSLTYGLMTDDAALVAKSAATIAEHAPIAPAELERIHGVLGTEMAEFERLDEEVHAASVRLSQAAEGGRTAEVLTRLNEVQRGCVACHTKFRQRLRTNPSR